MDRVFLLLQKIIPFSFPSFKWFLMKAFVVWYLKVLAKMGIVAF